jgi:hypothetical protein
MFVLSLSGSMRTKTVEVQGSKGDSIEKNV